MTVCTCGRDYMHCRICGSANVYRKKFESMRLSMDRGHTVEVYSCKGRGCVTTDTDMTCQAPALLDQMYPPKVRGDVARPQDVLDPTSDEYSQALQARFAEIIARKGMNEVKTVAVMRLEGWRIELDSESSGEAKPTTEPTAVGQSIDAPLPPITLEDIINSFTSKSKKDSRS